MMLCIWTILDPSLMPRKMRCFWFKVLMIIAHARCVVRIAYMVVGLKDLRYVLIFHLHVVRLFVRRCEYLVFRSSGTVRWARYCCNSSENRLAQKIDSIETLRDAAKRLTRDIFWGKLSIRQALEFFIVSWMNHLLGGAPMISDNDFMT